MTTCPIVLIDAVARFAEKRYALFLVAAWALAEAIILPVVPDVAIGLLALAAPRRAPVLFIALIVGSLIGTAVLWLLFLANPSLTHDMVMSVPGVKAAMLDDAMASFAAGNPVPFAQIGPGTPLKVFSLAWMQTDGDPITLAFWAFANRVARVGPYLLAYVAIGGLAGSWLRRHDRMAIAAYTALWIVAYAVYLL